MALIKCPECSQEISDKVQSCPHCGYPFQAKTTHQPSPDKTPNHPPSKSNNIGCLVIIVVVIFISMIYSALTPNDPSNPLGKPICKYPGCTSNLIVSEIVGELAYQTNKESEKIIQETFSKRKKFDWAN